MSGVWILGPSRSGTSMVAGLFAAHGVFFGDCVPPDQDNRKGYFENRWLKAQAAEGFGEHWPGDWFLELSREGWDGSAPWGAKGGPGWWDAVKATGPTVVVLCLRPADRILASRERHSWMRPDPKIPAHDLELIRQIEGDHCPVPRFSVDTEYIGTTGTAEALRWPLAMLGIEYDPAVAEDWIDSKLWGRP